MCVCLNHLAVALAWEPGFSWLLNCDPSSRSPQLYPAKCQSNDEQQVNFRVCVSLWLIMFLFPAGLIERSGPYLWSARSNYTECHHACLVQPFSIFHIMFSSLVPSWFIFNHLCHNISWPELWKKENAKHFQCANSVTINQICHLSHSARLAAKIQLSLKFSFLFWYFI